MYEKKIDVIIFLNARTQARAALSICAVTLGSAFTFSCVYIRSGTGFSEPAYPIVELVGELISLLSIVSYIYLVCKYYYLLFSACMHVLYFYRMSKYIAGLTVAS